MQLVNKKNRYCIYTCLIGNYDCLLNYNYYDKDFDYICFTNNTELINMKKVGNWTIAPVDSRLINKFNNTQINRYYKILQYMNMNDYDISMYIDSNISIKSPYIYELIKSTNKSFLVPKNIAANNIYQNLLYCYVYKQDTKQNLKKIYDCLQSENMPIDYGFTENNLLIRKHGDRSIEEIMKQWWFFIENYSKRDQTSFTYVLWKNNILVDDIEIPNVMSDRRNFTKYPHISSGLRLWNLHVLYRKNGRLYTPASNISIILRACKDTTIALFKYPIRKYLMYYYAGEKQMAKLFHEK